MNQGELFNLEFSIDPNADSKTCSKCLELLPMNCFGKTSGGSYLRTECRKCNNKLSSIRRSLKSLIEKPNKDYVCPICGADEEQSKGKGNNRNGPWVLDHNHKTNEFRGWLCHKCNRALGSFNDDEEVLLKAIKYLREETV